MNVDVFLLIIYVTFALLFSFLCSIAEAVLLSITPSYIEEQKEKFPKRAALLKRLRQDNIDQSLAAILTLNTIAHTVGAILSGAQATIVFGNTWFGLFSAFMTLAVLIFSEIVPKTIGAIHWAKLTGPTTTFVNSLILLLYPLVWLSERITKLISRGNDVHLFSRQEFLAMARIGGESGHLSDNESQIISNLFKFGSLRVEDIMTPRTVVSALQEDMIIEEAVSSIANAPFSRLPVYANDIHSVTGFVLKDDVLLREAQNRGRETLKSIKRPIHAVPEKASLSKLLEHLLKHHQHVAVVLDEYGETSGLVTLEDLVETLMGMEIVDEKDNVVDMRVLARKKWAERARAYDADGRIVE
jgi:CBS domain containing-hemolysin-like protein